MRGGFFLQVLLALCVAALVGLGVVIQGSIDSVNGLSDPGSHLKWLAVSCVVGAVVWFIPYTFFVRRAWLAYGACLLLLLLVPLIGVTRNASTRWIVIAGFSLQPSELMKFAAILAMAKMFRFRRDFSRPSTLIAPALLLAAPVVLIFGQPDLGTSLLFVPIGAGMLFVAGAERRHLLAAVAGGVLVGVVGYTLLLEPYQRERILSTVMRDRLTDAQRADEGHQLEQAIRSIAIGGVLGQGVGEGVQNRLDRLPYRHNDFIFAVIAEELGLVGALFLFAVLLTLLWVIFRVAIATRDPAGRLLCVGIGVLLGSQALVHIGVNVGVVPTTGMTLPFVSAGGTALLTFVAGIALVANVARRRVDVLSGDTMKEQILRLERIRRRPRRGGGAPLRSGGAVVESEAQRGA